MSSPRESLPGTSWSKAEAQQPGTSQGRVKLGGERRGGEGGIMNTTNNKHTIGTSPLMSCKNSIGRAGPGSDKLVSNKAVTSEAGGSNAGDILTSNAKGDASKAGVSDAGSRDLTYAPYTSPPHSLSRRGSFGHTNGRSNSVTRTRIHHTGPSTGGRPLLVGTPANAYFHH